MSAPKNDSCPPAMMRPEPAEAPTKRGAPPAVRMTNEEPPVATIGPGNAPGACKEVTPSVSVARSVFDANASAASRANIGPKYYSPKLFGVPRHVLDDSEIMVGAHPNLLLFIPVRCERASPKPVAKAREEPQLEPRPNLRLSEKAPRKCQKPAPQTGPRTPKIGQVFGKIVAAKTL